MKILRFIILSSVFIVVIGFASYSNAALVDNGDGTITQIRNDGSVLMWLKNAHLADTETFGVIGGISSGGYMNWNAANNWIAAMNAANYLGYNDWRLPATNPVDGSTYDYNFSYDGSTDRAYNVSAPGTAYPGSTGSELAYMFYTELGNLGYYDTAGNVNLVNGLSNTGPFDNLRSDYFYWSGTDYPITNYVWGMSFGWGTYSGYQNYVHESSSYYAWAVRVVPEPVSSILFIVGGITLGFRRFWKKRR